MTRYVRTVVLFFACMLTKCASNNVISTDNVGKIVAVETYLGDDNDTAKKLFTPYQYFVPANWSASSMQSVPILVFLHGGGDGPFDLMNKQSLPSLFFNKTFAQNFPFLTLMPCSTCGHSLAPNERGWTPANFERVNNLINDFIRAFRGDVSRIYLTGQSMGGHGLWKYAAAYPYQFAALVPICAAGPGKKGEQREHDISPLERVVDAVCSWRYCTECTNEYLATCSLHPFESGVRSRADGCGACPPVWMFHGQNDQVVPVELSDNMHEALQKKNGEDSMQPDKLRFTRYVHAPAPPMPEFARLEGHASYELAFRDPRLYLWLLAQSCPFCQVPGTVPQKYGEAPSPLPFTRARGHSAHSGHRATRPRSSKGTP